jgi:beta-glucanase (GH16 family)
MSNRKLKQSVVAILASLALGGCSSTAETVPLGPGTRYSFQHNQDGKSCSIIIPGVFSGGRITAGEQYLLKMTGSSSQAAPEFAQMYLLDGSQAANWWEMLSDTVISQKIDGTFSLQAELTATATASSAGADANKLQVTLFDAPSPPTWAINSLFLVKEDKTEAPIVANADASTPDIPGLENYHLLFQDNFDEKSLNTDFWSPNEYYRQWGSAKETSKRRGGWWDPDQVFLRDGDLIIEPAYKNGKYGPGFYSGELASNGRVSFKYGYFECRAKLPLASGVWSAFWMMPFVNSDAIKGGTDGTEIDIFESPYAGKADKDAVQHNLNWDGYDAGHQTTGSGRVPVSAPYTTFHTYGVEWTPDAYVFSIDGKETWRTDAKGFGVSQVMSYLLLSCEVEGQVVNGVPTPADPSQASWVWTSIPDPTMKPTDFVVDYVRVYQKQ